MKAFFAILCLGCSLVACNTNNQQGSNLDIEELYKKHGVEGCFLLKALNSEQLYTYNPDRCQQGFLPASTFKIVNSIIALETGVAANENLEIKWDSVERQIKAWNQDHTMKTAFQVSCVPYYQEIAKRIGPARMQEGLRKLNFGKMDVNQETIFNFWLKGKSRVTPYEQLDFIERLANKELPIKPSTVHIMRDIMKIVSNDSGMVMRGKTGWAIADGANIGWFVGYIERPDGERFIFINNVEAPVGKISDKDFMMSRKSIVGEVLTELGVI